MQRHITRPTVATVFGAALSVASIAGTAGFLIGRYPLFRPYLPVEFSAEQLPSRWVAKTYTLVLMPVWVQLVLALVFGAIAIILLWRAVPPADPGEARLAAEDAERMLITAEAVVLLSAIWITFQALGAVELDRLWERGWGGYRPFYVQALVTAIVLSGVVGVRAMASVGRPARRTEPGPASCWRFRHLYFNPNDPALFVPARQGVGWTVNFGQARAIGMMLLVLSIGVGGPFLIVRYLITG
jgi:uncharacterized membrane protein